MIVALVLLSAFLHAGWNALLRVEPDKDRGLVGAIIVASLFAIVIAGVRWGAGAVPFATGEALVWTLAAGVAEAIYFTTLAKALELGRLGAVYTVSRGGAVLVVWPVSMVVFSELVTVLSATGSGLVMLGLGLSSIGGTQGGTQRHREGIAWAAVCAVSIAGYHLAYKAALLAGGNPSATFAVSLSLSAVICAVRIGRAGRRTLVEVVRARAARVTLMGIVCGGSFLILMEALARGGSGFVLTLRNTSVLFAAALAFTIGEKPSRTELIGAVFVAGGAVLMSL
ncbi:MAG: EamA family transporter [Deltaproteobacteria bacterium]|nr:EamA family transporter [Deltaproteobacteria bacterium]